MDNKFYEGEHLDVVTKAGGSISHQLSYHLYKISEMDDETETRMIIGDLYGIIKDKKTCIDNIIIFSDLTIDIGRKDMEDIILYLTLLYSNTIFCYQSAPMVKDFPEEPTKEQTEIELMHQAMHLEYLGFRNINVLCGFENSIAYLYLNEEAKPIMEDIFYREIVTNHPI